jgi:hypothetical protein
MKTSQLIKFFVLQEKWAWGNPSGKPSRPTHPGSRKIRLLDHFVSKYNKISLKIRVLKFNCCKNRRCGEYVVWIKALIDKRKQKKYNSER